MTAERIASPRAAQAAEFVLANSMLRPVPLVPEIRLHLGEGPLSLWEAAGGELGAPEQPPPFWAFAGPGGQALARYLLDHPDRVAGRAVLDLGSGSGLAAIAAAMAGASAVLASELDPFASAAIELNAAANRVPLAVTGDVLDGECESAAVVLAADIWNEIGPDDRALALLRRARARGAAVLAGAVGRAFLPPSARLERAPSA